MQQGSAGNAWLCPVMLRQLLGSELEIRVTAVVSVSLDEVARGRMWHVGVWPWGRTVGSGTEPRAAGGTRTGRKRTGVSDLQSPQRKCRSRGGAGQTVPEATEGSHQISPGWAVQIPTGLSQGRGLGGRWQVSGNIPVTAVTAAEELGPPSLQSGSHFMITAL